jgi:DNA-binding CsgD family transcriptional regulator
MVIVDDQRRYLEANPPALSALGLDLAELRRLRVDDFTPPHMWPVMEERWAQLMAAGFVVGPDDAPRELNYLDMNFWALAHALPGRHVVAFAPPGWREPDQPGETNGRPQLTRRELQVLRLAAEGHDGPAIARQLVLSDATVKSHFGNLYSKLGVRDRAGAVARAIRLGLIP